MVEEKPVNVPTPTERNAFPVTRSIIAGILSLVAVRYIFGLVPLAYPTDREHVDFYYRGLVVSVPAPKGHCYTGQADFLENISQVKMAFVDPEEVFKFITFRTFRECSSVYSDERTVHGYNSFFSPRFYWQDAMVASSPWSIGFAGVGAELLPSSLENAAAWLESRSLENALKSRVWSSRLLPYFPQSDSRDESFMISAEQSISLEGAGKCTAAIGRFINVDYGFSECSPDRDECEANFDRGIENYWSGPRNNYADLDERGMVEKKGFAMMALYVVPFRGRAIYYGFAQEIDFVTKANNYSDFREWGEQVCRSAQEVSAESLKAEEAERGVIGYSR